jgi:hypothetical protein
MLEAPVASGTVVRRPKAYVRIRVQARELVPENSGNDPPLRGGLNDPSLPSRGAAVTDEQGQKHTHQKDMSSSNGLGAGATVDAASGGLYRWS